MLRVRSRRSLRLSYAREFARSEVAERRPVADAPLVARRLVSRAGGRTVDAPGEVIDSAARRVNESSPALAGLDSGRSGGSNPRHSACKVMRVRTGATGTGATVRDLGGGGGGGAPRAVTSRWAIRCVNRALPARTSGLGAGGSVHAGVPGRRGGTRPSNAHRGAGVGLIRSQAVGAELGPATGCPRDRPVPTPSFKTKVTVRARLAIPDPILARAGGASVWNPDDAAVLGAGQVWNVRGREVQGSARPVCGIGSRGPRINPKVLTLKGASELPR